MAASETTTGDDEITFYKGGKTKARKALERIGAHALAAEKTLLVQHGVDATQWGFYRSEAIRIQETGEKEEQEALNPPAPVVEEPVLDPAAVSLDVPGMMDPVLPEATPAPELPEDEPANTAAAGAFASLGNTLQTAPISAPAPVARAASRTAYTIEKNRPQQNGVTRPSAGGMCRDVWDACDDMMQKNNGIPPVAKDLRAWNEAKQLNLNNTMIEFYQWRRFNGIMGRTPKATPAPVAAPAQA